MSIENNEYLLISWLLKVRNQSKFMNMCSECVVSNWECPVEIIGLVIISVCEIFRTCPDRPCAPLSLLYNGYRVFPGGKERPGRDANLSPLSRAVGHERVELFLYSHYGPYGLYRASVPLQGCTYFYNKTYHNFRNKRHILVFRNISDIRHLTFILALRVSIDMLTLWILMCI